MEKAKELLKEVEALELSDDELNEVGGGAGVMQIVSQGPQNNHFNKREDVTF